LTPPASSRTAPPRLPRPPYLLHPLEATLFEAVDAPIARSHDGIEVVRSCSSLESKHGLESSGRAIAQRR